LPLVMFDGLFAIVCIREDGLSMNVHRW
jgi:hypothetical protein